MAGFIHTGLRQFMRAHAWNHTWNERCLTCCFSTQNNPVHAMATSAKGYGKRGSRAFFFYFGNSGQMLHSHGFLSMKKSYDS